jgi:hypothetical protein
MASVSRISGLRLVKNQTGGSMTGQVETMFVPASDASVIMVGDPVKLLGDARAASGVPTVTRISGATDIPVGVVVGISFEGQGDVTNVPPVNDLNTPVYRRASTDRYLLVCVDPQAVYEVQASQTSQSAATVTSWVGSNASFTTTAGSTTTGASGIQMDTTTVATTATLPLKIVGIPNRPDNIPGDTFINLYVRLNSSTLRVGWYWRCWRLSKGGL